MEVFCKPPESLFILLFDTHESPGRVLLAAMVLPPGFVSSLAGICMVSIIVGSLAPAYFSAQWSVVSLRRSTHCAAFVASGGEPDLYIGVDPGIETSE
jgi:UPF0716 family protein affecting phage T7 exclusion